MKTHWPNEHVALLAQGLQPAPLDPQAKAVFPLWQTPVVSQHPLHELAQGALGLEHENHSNELASRHRVSLIGHQHSAKMPELLQAVLTPQLVCPRQVPNHWNPPGHAHEPESAPAPEP